MGEHHLQFVIIIKNPVLELTDLDLYKRIKRGNELAFDVLFKKYYAPLCRFAVMFTRDNDNAEEIVQSFFVKLWQQRKKLKINSSVKSYLYTSVRNTALNYIKKEQTRSIYEDNYVVDKKEPETINVENEDFNKIYKKAVEQLPDRTKQVFILSKNEGLSYNEIAEYLQITAKTVENNMGIAFKKLREFLMPYKHLVYE
ncbi:MAG: RNA polymerase sigma-70 factor [Candidatus Cloacimonetes bacterium]|nr:RNA polymerase sigma-70 factor [Candidatus Cloacimonadota bacterium]